MSKYKLTLSFIALFSFLLIFSCNNSKKSDAENKEVEVLPEDIVELRSDQIKMANIQIGAFEKKVLSGILKVSGTVTVAPENLATICMPMGGFVKSISLMPGTRISKGQTLAILENQEFVDIQQNYLEAKNKLEFAEAEYIRHTELYKNEVYSQQNVQQVTADYKNLKAQVKGLEQKLALIGILPSGLKEDDISSAVKVVSPINGYVKTININIGKFVSSSDVLFEIVNSDQLLLELTLFEKDADKVTIGEKIHFYINNEAEQHEALVTQTGKSITADRTFKVYAKVTDVCKNILPGMYVNALIEADGNEVLALPSEAVVSFDDKDYIFVLDKEKIENGKPFTEYRMIEIHKGISNAGYTGILLPDGFNFQSAKVVLKGAYNLLSAKKNAGEMSC